MTTPISEIRGREKTLGESYENKTLDVKCEYNLRRRSHKWKNYFGVYAKSIEGITLVRPKLIATLYWDNGKAKIAREFGEQKTSSYDADQKHGLTFLRRRAIEEYKRSNEAKTQYKLAIPNMPSIESTLSN